MLDMPLIRYFICRIYLSSLLHTCESHGKKKKKKSIFGFPCLRKRYVLSQVYERQYTYVGCMRYEIVIIFYHTHK